MKQKVNIILVLVFMIFLCSCQNVDSREKEFQNVKNEFETVKNFMLLHNMKETHEISYEVLRNEGIVIGLDNVNDIDPDIVKALNEVSNLFKHDFSYVQYTPERISFGGNGSEMFVYVVNNDNPDYFYYSGDNVDFSCKKLDDNWFFLYNRVR